VGVSCIFYISFRYIPSWNQSCLYAFNACKETVCWIFYWWNENVWSCSCMVRTILLSNCTCWRSRGVETLIAGSIILPYPWVLLAMKDIFDEKWKRMDYFFVIFPMEGTTNKVFKNLYNMDFSWLRYGLVNIDLFLAFPELFLKT
jgi:hypothetical protein